MRKRESRYHEKKQLSFKLYHVVLLLPTILLGACSPQETAAICAQGNGRVKLFTTSSRRCTTCDWVCPQRRDIKRLRASSCVTAEIIGSLRMNTLTSRISPESNCRGEPARWRTAIGLQHFGLYAFLPPTVIFHRFVKRKRPLSLISLAPPVLGEVFLGKQLDKAEQRCSDWLIRPLLSPEQRE